MISQEQLSSFKIIVPSLHDQKKIVAFLNQRIFEIDKLIERKYNSVLLLKEYRTALISEAVTGKLDVRDEVLASGV